MSTDHPEVTPPEATPQSPIRDPDLRHVEAALIRAAANARALALATGTPCYVWKDGRIVNIGTPAQDA